MPIQRGEYVRPNNPNHNLPRESVWYVVSAADGLKLEPENAVAQRVERRAVGLRFAAEYFDKVVRCRGQWVSVRDAELPFDPTLYVGDDGRTAVPAPEPAQRLTHADDVDRASFAAKQAASAAAAMHRLLEDARKQERQRQEELREAKAAKAKADKEAAARAKMEEARNALAANLHADRCLAEATLELIAEVSRLNNGGEERPATTSIAAHAGQLQEMARSYGYRIVKPSKIALVVKL